MRDTGVDSCERKLAIGAANQQHCLAAALTGEQGNRIRFHPATYKK